MASTIFTALDDFLHSSALKFARSKFPQMRWRVAEDAGQPHKIPTPLT